MHRLTRVLAFSTLALILAALAGPAQAHGRAGVYVGAAYPGARYAHGYGYWGPRRYWGGVNIGIGVGPGGYYYGGPYAPYYYPGYPSYAVTLPPPAAPYDPQPAPLAKGQPDPIFYPRNGQSPQQVEADRQACDRWALTQPLAAARADVFQRATLACMEGRGYTVR